MMRLRVALSLLLLSFLVVFCFFISKVDQNGTRERNLTTLVAANETTTFRQLSCNENFATASCGLTWSAMFTNQSLHSSEIIIPCGQCVTMDHASSSELVLEGGIDVQGKLVFPDGYKLTLQTPYIRVQGELHMYSSKIPNGEPDVKFILTGTDENATQFFPADSNAQACGDEPCQVGKKPIVIAGGKLVIEALREGFPSWVNVYDVIPADSSPESRSQSLILTDRVQNQWGIGAQLLITSHTQRFDEEQTRTITNITSHAESGYVVVELDSTILRPTTETDNPNFSVEVALLARNIVFEGANDDSNPDRGAHLIVFHTPLIKQKLEGVEFRNFGQQGKLGRYPIHFHLSGYVTGSIVSKNLIRESNQRCIVVHGTHYLHVEGNVAYNTAGHCFMTEDGQEQYNMFRDNLGALTRRVEVLIPEDDRVDGEETDDRPSTFWMTNPTNSWEGNVAAGSEDNGFWLELRSSVRGPEAELYPDLNPRKAPLTLFHGNVAHSNRNKGIRTYPQGFEPPDEAVFVGCRSYRNGEDGVFFHNSKDLTVVGGIYADNREQLDFDRAEFITLRDAEVIGVSLTFRNLMQTQDVDRVCRYDKVVGVQLHTFTRRSTGMGASLQNVTFSGFVDTGCEKAFAIDFDEEVRRGTFDYFSVFEDISVEEGAVPVDLCEARDVGVDDVWLTDLHSSLQPPSTSRSFSGTSTIITQDSWISTFLSSNDCLVFANQCLAYCEDTCLRTVTYGVDPTGSESYKMRVCSDAGTCIEVNNTFWYEEEDTEVETLIENTRVDRLRYFAVTLPKGSYQAEILDANGGNRAWPTFVEEIYQDSFCTDALEDGSVELIVPSVPASECRNLIRNGDAEESPTNHTYWLHRHGGVSLRPGKGVDGSNAIDQLNSTEADRDALAQFLDVRCFDLMRGRQYEVVAFVKLETEVTSDAYECTPSADSYCPEVGLYWKSTEGGWSREDIATVVATATPEASGYQRMHGVLDVTDEVADASTLFLYIRRHVEGTTLLVDNVSMTLVSADSHGGCDTNLVFNGDFSIGDSRFWFDGDDRALALVSPGYDESSHALSSFEGNMEQYIRTGCMKPGESYRATAKFKLIGSNGQFACRTRRATDETKCPIMQLRFQMNGEHGVDTVAKLAGDSSDTDWSTLLGGFQVADDFANAESVRVQFRSVPDGATLVVGSVVIERYSSAYRLGVMGRIAGAIALSLLTTLF